MADHIRDSDIIKTLNGESNQAEASREAILGALKGQSPEPDAFQSAVLEALGHPAPASTDAGERSQGDAVALWAANDAVNSSLKTLAESLMKNTGKGYWEAQADAKKIAAEAYEEAAKGSPYEVNRKEAVARIVTKLAERLARQNIKQLKESKTPSRQVNEGRGGRQWIKEAATGRIRVIR